MIRRQVEPKLQRHLSRQQSEVEQLLNRLSAQLPNPSDRLVCIINNYDVILNILEERVTCESKEKSSFWELQQTRVSDYVEAMLWPHFGELITFVTECEPLIEQGHTQLLIRYSEKVTAIVRSFSANWKKSIDAINKQILESFTNFKNGTNILQVHFSNFLYVFFPIQTFVYLVSEYLFNYEMNAS
ncbi:unnamed protein product [Anisakis simplex]|uniref:Vacuolar protein sorting-associated protein 52 homolog n=1 Tax=Anisakis simplex TaxID=6269 RepID=A0A0M3J931_ANISI|nr:unnamed protein product [Anisakis simplex]